MNQPTHKPDYLFNFGYLNLDKLIRLQQKTEPFTPGEPLFWNDPHISQQMLAAHLSQNTDAASRKQETIARTVDWLVKYLGLKIGQTVLDLGCGPGLYATRLALQGLQVTGVDYSERSIDYATRAAQEQGLEITYRYQDYLTISDNQQYDLTLLIYGDYYPLSPEQRNQLLQNVLRALKPGGYFVLDVTTRAGRTKFGQKNGWYVLESGFWKPGPHLVLEEGFDYPEQNIYLDQSTVIEADGKISVYRNWFQDFDGDSITRELTRAGLRLDSLWNDLQGTPFSEGGDWIGVVAQKL
ncbi:MAG: class I SAM-dependent methyltransferase [Anaerolineaceae bacterium]|nr:class I SAM-dependent methyltransferase [Anaerolineaceae bacterium]